jgi:hypothetical protein
MIKSMDSPQLKEMLPRLVQGFVQALGSHTATEYIEIFFKYLTKASGVLVQEDFQKALSYLPEGGEKIMDTLADQWMEQGERSGFIKGEIKNAQEMLLEAISEKFGAVSPDLIRRVNSIDSHETLKMLFKQTFRVDSLEEFKEQVHRATDN